MGWVAAVDGYEVSLTGGGIACRSANGKVLKTIPKAVKDAPAVTGLRQVKEWLDRHDAACLREVEDWLVRSLPVPTVLLASVWPDRSWRAALHDAVVVPVDPSGVARLGEGGFLREVDADGRLGVVDLDGESGRRTADRVVLPHPVLLDDLDDLREFAADLGVTQGVQQLFREIWRPPDDPAELAAEAARYAGGQFAQLRHLTGRATGLGYAVRGGYVTRRLWEGGQVIDACVWVGADDPSVVAYTGDLTFVDSAGAQVPLAAVGPVAWSEGMQMASALYAGRVVEQEGAA